MDGGFITVERAIFDNPKMRGKDDIYAAIWLVARAAWKPTTVKPVRHPVDLERGQCAYAVSFMATAWECSKATAHARLRHFEKIGFIRTEARTDCTLITVCNYDKYQQAPNDARTDVRTPPERSPNAPRTNKKEDNQFKELDDDARCASAPESTMAEPTDIIAAFEDAREEVLGENQRRPWPHAQDHGTAKRWIEAGADLPLCQAVFASVLRQRAASNAQPPGSLKYFDGAIADAIAARDSPMPQPRAQPEQGARSFGRDNIRRIC